MPTVTKIALYVSEFNETNVAIQIIANITNANTGINVNPTRKYPHHRYVCCRKIDKLKRFVAINRNRGVRLQHNDRFSEIIEEMV
jgi:hypothetical protein